MGLLDAFLLRDRAEAYSGQIESLALAVDAQSVDPALFGSSSFLDQSAPAGRVSRREAIQVPAVKRCRDLVAGSLGQLPLRLVGPDKQSSPWPLFDQPEAGVPRSVTMTRTFEDMLLEGVAWWVVREFAWDGYPKTVSRVDPSRVSVDEARGRVYVDGEWVTDDRLIRFDSPNDPLLVAGARAIRTAALLEGAAARNADGTPPMTYLSTAEGADPDIGEEDLQEVLDGYAAAVRRRATPYVGAGLKVNVLGWSPQQLQLAEARQHAVLEIARCAGVDPEELGVSTTSRTYANQFDRRKAFLDFVLGPYMSAVQDRLSMGDASKRGFQARFDVDVFLRTDAKTRYESYLLGLEAGALAPDEVRELEDRPPLTAAQRPAPSPAPQEPAVPVAASLDLAAEDGVFLDPAPAATFSVDPETRTIRGLAVPYGVVARKNGTAFQFSRGSLRYADVGRVKLWVDHDRTRAVGVAVELDDREDGLYAAFRVARGPEGDRALQLAEDGVLDGLSVGAYDLRATARDGVMHVSDSHLREVSLTAIPAYDDARVLSVAASAHATEGVTMENETAAETESADFSAITDAIADGFAGLRAPQEGREVVPAGGATFEVDEPSPYRFDGHEGAHSFAMDMRDASQGDAEARQRLAEFGENFAVTTGNAATLNPTQNRPDLYVPNLTYTRPLWESVTTGSISDKTPFTIPKFGTAAGLVGPHTEGVEPTPGSFTATNQTVTPSAISGKIEINREVLDQGGSPKADAIIWAEMLNAWYEALESRVASQLGTIATAELNLAGATDAALVNALTDYYAGLQFVRGGNRFTGLVLDGMLFPKLVSAADSTGRKLLPVLGPSNAQGTVSGAFDRVQLGNQTGRAAWALGSSNASKSYSFVPSSVWAWASAPKRFDFQYQVKSVDMAIWGYAATAVTRDADVKPIDYTTADA